MTSAPSELSPAYSDRYAAISSHLLRQAQKELDAGDVLQASEKAWGAAARAIKAVASMWGWYHQGHYRLDATVHYIVSDRGREDLLGWYDTVGALHRNYYEHELHGDTVQMAIHATGNFVTEMGKIREEDVPVFPPSESLTRSQGRRLRLLNAPPTDNPPRYVDVSHLPPVEPEPPEVR